MVSGPGLVESVGAGPDGWGTDGAKRSGDASPGGDLKEHGEVAEGTATNGPARAGLTAADESDDARRSSPGKPNAHRGGDAARLERHARGAERAAHDPDDLPTPADPSRLPAILGCRLDRVVRLADGRIVAVVDAVDEVTRAAAESCGAVAVPRAAVEPLSLLGDASPFAQAKLVATGLAAERDAEAERRQATAVLARRKLRAAEAMLGAELPAEAIAAARDAMVAAVSGLAAAGEPELPAARLLFEILVPAGRLTLEQAALVAKADGLARAYGSAAVPPPAVVAQSVLEDARRVVDGLTP